MPELSKALDIKTTAAENYYRAAKKRLGDELRSRVECHIRRYCADQDAAAEFEAEWAQLAEFLGMQGGLEQAVRRSYQAMAASGPVDKRSGSFLMTLERFEPKPQQPPEESRDRSR